MITLEKKYDLLIGTLNWYLLPKKETGVSYLEAIDGQMAELEGDHHTFLYKDFIQELVERNYFPAELARKIAQIRMMTEAIDDRLWNAMDFIGHVRWQEIRILVLDVLKDAVVERS